MAPGVVADHVAVGEHATIDRPAVGRDLLSDLEEGGVDVLALEYVQELRRIGPRSVVEGERDHAMIRRSVGHVGRPARRTADHLRRVQTGQDRLGREHHGATEPVGNFGRHAGGASVLSTCHRIEEYEIPMLSGRKLAVRLLAPDRVTAAAIT